MRAAPLLAGLFLVALVSSVLAQTPECTSYVGNAERVCAAAVDGTRAFHPVVGCAGQRRKPDDRVRGHAGGLGHASLTLRANAVEVVLPDLGYNGSSSTVPAGDKLFAPAPLVEGSLGALQRDVGDGSARRGFSRLGAAASRPTRSTT